MVRLLMHMLLLSRWCVDGHINLSGCCWWNTGHRGRCVCDARRLWRRMMRMSVVMGMMLLLLLSMMMMVGVCNGRGRLTGGGARRMMRMWGGDTSGSSCWFGIGWSLLLLLLLLMVVVMMVMMMVRMRGGRGWRGDRVWLLLLLLLLLLVRLLQGHDGDGWRHVNWHQVLVVHVDQLLQVIAHVYVERLAVCSAL